jgi:hypothetical protein
VLAACDNLWHLGKFIPLVLSFYRRAPRTVVLLKLQSRSVPRRTRSTPLLLQVDCDARTCRFDSVPAV